MFKFCLWGRSNPFIFGNPISGYERQGKDLIQREMKVAQARKTVRRALKFCEMVISWKVVPARIPSLVYDSVCT